MKKDTFPFKQKLIEVGFNPELVEDWMKIRKAKKAVDTETAFNGFIREVVKSGHHKNLILRICVEQSWKGFTASWDISKFLPTDSIVNNGNQSTIAKTTLSDRMEAVKRRAAEQCSTEGQIVSSENKNLFDSGTFY